MIGIKFEIDNDKGKLGSLSFVYFKLATTGM